MAFNKTAHLRQNIDAIKVAFTLEREQRKATPQERDVLKTYSGFGGIKEVLEPLPPKNRTALTPLLEELHVLLKQNTANDKEYNRYVYGIKSSILTAFYTPPHIVESIVMPLLRTGITPRRILDPSAGNGIFSSAFQLFEPDAEMMCFEKDAMTGLILKHLHPGNNVQVQGYETIAPRYVGYFDLAISNIPFGDVALFDPFFATHTDPVRRQATRSMHSYFFMKSVDTVREGGLIAFITSQGLLDSDKNRPVREWLMELCEPVSILRLPNNLFTDYAGTEVGSDLIVLQKKNAGNIQSPRRLDFIETRTLSNGIKVNDSFQTLDRVIHTASKVGTNPYGQPALEFTHAAGVAGIAKDMRRMLDEDFALHLDLKRYQLFAPEEIAQEQTETPVPQEDRLKEPVRAGVILQKILSELKPIQQEVPHEQTSPEYPSHDWNATEEDWRNFNDWFETRQSVTALEAQGYRLDESTGEMTRIVQAAAEPVRNTPTQAEMADFAAWADGRDRLFKKQHPPQPQDYAIQEPLPQGATIEPAATEATVEPKTHAPARPQRNGFAGTLFDQPSTGSPTTEAAPELNVQQQPLITLYDLFGFSAEERSQVERPRRRSKKKAEKKSEEEQHPLDWREEMMLEGNQRRQQEQKQDGRSATEAALDPERRTARQESQKGSKQRPGDDTVQVHSLEDTLKTEQQEQSRKREEYFKPIPFKAEILKHYREGSLVTDQDNRIGTLRDLDGLQPMFHPLELSAAQEKKASLYIEIRDTYYHLYDNEADRLEANTALREMLNRLYDEFTKHFGELNEKKNLDLIKMDPSGTEILSLERYIDGVAQKADIFDHPVVFNPSEITQADDAQEALLASLNKSASVDLQYMASLTGATQEDILEQLKERIYFNPMIDGYEVADKFIAGNVIVKGDQVEVFLKENPGHPAAESLRALRDATPSPIAFEDLDFNFGERWILTGVYNRYASYLFDTQITIHYLPDMDEFSVSAEDQRNVKIQNQYAVDSESRRFNGLHLMKHALHNTSPDITKTVYKDHKPIKVRDGEKIQLANTKIDEIRNGFTDWLREQSPEFKTRLANLYNRKFNCFVRPHYDGSHQSFPGLDLKGLGIKDLYGSQKDAIWMDKLLGGGIDDHEVLRP